MTWWDAITRKWKRTPPTIPVTIDGAEYTVTESARRQAAENMRLDHAKRDAVERLLCEKLGDGRGRAEMLRRYPESFR